MLTTKDWIARASAEPTVAEALARAEAAARWPDDWLEVADAWVTQGRPEEARRCIAMTLAPAEHWPCRRAAELLLAKLDDREAAVAALARVATRLTVGERVRAYEWVLLGRAYREVLGDEREVRHCIERAAAMVVSTNDLADLAGGYVELLGDRVAARALLERAEHVARSTVQLRELWNVAIRWKESLGDSDRARATLMIATADSTAVTDLTAFAIAWRLLFDDESQVRAALVRAETLATTAEHWLDVAEGYFDGGRDNRVAAWDPEAVRRALEAGLAANPTDEERAAITIGYRDWLGIAADAAGLAPALQAPEAALTAERTLDGWDDRRPRVLLDRLRERLTPDRLEAIAKADYGIAWLKHQRMLVEIHATGLIPIPVTWHPLEALELYRWQRGADTDHVARGFACAILALDAVSPSSRQCGHIGDVVAPLIESTWAIGLADELEAALVWLAEVARSEDFAWPLLGLVLSRARRAPDDPRLVKLVADLIAAESASTSTWSDTGWLFRTTNFDSFHDLWRQLAADALVGASSAHLVELARLLRVVT